ncbi:alpha/beta hydrolase [Parendozoicomonas haliclonae]|uniref:Thermostable monoacylglycerol lipase n=1 Tax=Parendozoicomonas haliclonae TaxID=1960125 RepID=A0A1X7ARG3_9GAMM|nr:alpha/beta fold hydrolase [Parendozoicomonas haliclonae]SMA50732.1 Thermostable monoacylglycerol lipase [Parendozoicomonas haliclonae]
MLRNIIAIFATGLVVVGCSQVPDAAHYQPSSSTPAYTQSSFEAYVQETRQWLMANRAFISSDKAREVNANAPFELKPEKGTQPSKGILLVHGLGDSPYSFVDLAPALAAQGFTVRTLLLTGHGARPGDLLNVDVQDWRQAVAHHTALLKQDVDEVWLGGFSTGANLVTSEALADNSIAGLVVFSPAYQPRSQLVALAPYVAKVADWADADPSDNIVRFDSLTFQTAGAYYRTTQSVSDALRFKAFNRPVMMVLSADDSVVDAEQMLALFEQRFTHPRSQLIWYGDAPESSDSRLKVLPTRLPEQRVSNFSHMAALFAPENPYYGVQGEYRICNNGQDDSEEGEKAVCPPDEQLWFSAYGYLESNKVHARLTWNPYFSELVEDIQRVTETSDR